jgi:tRNA uridine 5-carbamoylmethylation protein Kti12
MSYLLIIRGSLGCGKTTIAKKLSGTLRAEYIGIDRVLEEKGLDKIHESGYISQASFIKANKLVRPRVLAFLKKGTKVIFDGNFYWQSQIDDLLNTLPYPHAIFTLQAPLEVCIERDKNRPVSHGKDAVEAVFCKSTALHVGIPIDATSDVDSAIKQILAHLPSV